MVPIITVPVGRPRYFYTLIDILKTASAAILHANPQFISPQIRSVICDYIGVATIAHHDYLLLDDEDVVALLQLDHLDGRQVVRLDPFRLQI